MTAHLHVEQKHGDEVVEALKMLELTEQDIADLTHGSQVGAKMYLRMLAWALQLDSLSNAFEVREELEASLV
ncbi:MAG: hypothetical protein K2Z81_11675 [Cyanobacteria bacterium]|nr:hypothetical protein [Cyanobacteriota bacterium]